MGENFVQYGLHLREGPVLLPLEAPIHRELTLTKQHVLDKKKERKRKEGEREKGVSINKKRKLNFGLGLSGNLVKKKKHSSESRLPSIFTFHLYISSHSKNLSVFLFYLDKISLLGHSSNHYGCTSCARKAILPLAFNTYIVHKFT